MSRSVIFTTSLAMMKRYFKLPKVEMSVGKRVLKKNSSEVGQLGAGVLDNNSNLRK